MKESNQLFRWLFYLLGLLILAVGLTLNTKTGQGVTPIVSVPYCISQLSGLNFGNMTLLIYCLFVAALAQRTGREMGLVKNCFDLLNVCLTLAMGFAFAQPFCGIGLGTLLAMVGVGRVIALFNRFCRLPLGRLAGLEAAAA